MSIRTNHLLYATSGWLSCCRAFCRELQQHLSICVAVVRSFVGHLESLAADLNDLGRSMSHMARYEEQLAQRQGQYTASGTSSTQRAADLQLVGYAALRQQAVEKQVTELNSLQAASHA